MYCLNRPMGRRGAVEQRAGRVGGEAAGRWAPEGGMQVGGRRYRLGRP